MDVKTPGIYEKLYAIMAEVDFIAKDKNNSGQNYKYLSEQAIKERLHPLLVKHRVLFIAKDMELLRFEGEPGKMKVTTIKFTYEFYDLDTGTSVTGAMIGSGADSTDKGAFKAITGALKYALTTAFVIPTGDDPEKEGGKKLGSLPQRRSSEDGGDSQPQARRGDPNAVITEPQRRRILALMSKSGKNIDQVKEIIARHGFQSSHDITAGKYDAICTEVERS